MEVRNRFKGLDLIDRVPDEPWTELRHCTGDRDEDHPHVKEMQKSKREKAIYTHVNAKLQRIARRDKKAFLSDQCKEIEENNKW